MARIKQDRADVGVTDDPVHVVRGRAGAKRIKTADGAKRIKTADSTSILRGVVTEKIPVVTSGERKSVRANRSGSIKGRIAPVSRWLELATRFPLRPIRAADQFEAATALMNELLDTERSEEEDDYLDVLSDLVGDWEDEHHEIPEATPGVILRALIEDKGVTQAEVAAATGIAEANLSAMLANKRGIGKTIRAKLAAYFGVKPARFVVE